MVKVFWDGSSSSVFMSGVERTPRNELTVERSGDYLSLYSTLFEHYEIKDLHYTRFLDREGLPLGDADSTEAYLVDTVSGTVTVDNEEVGEGNDVIIYQTTVSPTINITNIFGNRGMVFRDLADYLEVQVILVLEGVLSSVFQPTDSLVVQYYDGSWKELARSDATEWQFINTGSSLVITTALKEVLVNGGYPIRLVSERASIDTQILASSAKGLLRFKR